VVLAVEGGPRTTPVEDRTPLPGEGRGWDNQGNLGEDRITRRFLVDFGAGTRGLEVVVVEGAKPEGAAGFGRAIPPGGGERNLPGI